MNILHILQTDKATHKWHFPKAFKFDAMHQWTVLVAQCFRARRYVIFTRIRTYELLFTIQCSARIRFWSPLCLCHGLNNWTIIKPILYMNIVHILQTDKATHKWHFFPKAFNLMPCINELYLWPSVFRRVCMCHRQLEGYLIKNKVSPK